MKYKLGEKIVFIKNNKKIYPWKLIDNNYYEVTSIAHHSITSNRVYSVKGDTDDGFVEVCWFDEEDFISIKEFRKLKLKKLNETNLYK